MNTELLAFLKDTEEELLSYYRSHRPFSHTPEELHRGAFVYFERGGKRLRPGICRLAAGEMGGERAAREAVPCALALELYHNWTLIHDDMIDHDDTRRGKKSVHRLIRDEFSGVLSASCASEYAMDTALLAGDALHSASIAYLSHLSDSGFVPPAVTLRILSLLEGEYGPRLICGETEDTKLGLFYPENAMQNVTSEEILAMIAGKTGALFGISALSGAMIGAAGDPEKEDACFALARFAEACGMAFQLQDDILGVTADETKLGKPVGSDIREGKPTLLLLASYKNASAEEKEFLDSVVGKSDDPAAIEKARALICARGGIEETRHTARAYLKEAEKALAPLPPSPWKKMLEQWKDSMLQREM